LLWVIIEEEEEGLLYAYHPYNLYHYLGHKPLPGAQLRYFITAGEQIVAMAGFRAAAWQTGKISEKLKAVGNLADSQEKFVFPSKIFGSFLLIKNLEFCSNQLIND